VALVQIDVVGSQSPQRALDTLEQVLAGEAGIVRVRGDRKECLRRDHQVTSRDVREGLAEGGFGASIGVHIGGVEEVDAGIECGVHDRSRARDVDA